jgi:hypothetical protein
VNRLPDTIETFTGLAFDYNDPQVTVEDVAHHLSQTCRFAGACVRFYSVAEHSVLVHRLVADMEPDLALAALFHDAHEAYLGDIVTPLKSLIGQKRKTIARRIDSAVAGLIDVPAAHLYHPIVKAADDLAITYEASQLMTGPGWRFAHAMKHAQAEAAMGQRRRLGLTPKRAEALFLRAHEQAVEARG